MQDRDTRIQYTAVIHNALIKELRIAKGLTKINLEERDLALLRRLQETLGDQWMRKKG